MKKLIFKVFCWAVAISLFGCGFAVKDVVPREQSSATEVYFCPRENCSSVFEREIINAKSSVHCALYDLNLENLISAFYSKSKAIDVKLVMDETSEDTGLKGNVRFDGSSQLMHNKFCIIDDFIVLTGSFNPTFNDNNLNNNNLIILHSKFLSSNYEDEFDELWSGNFGKGSRVQNPAVYLNDAKIENYFCPEDNCADKVVSLIKNAKKSVYFMTFSFTSEKIADALISRDGIEIKGVFDKGQASNKYSQDERLKGFGMDVILDKSKYKLHHKVFIIDNETVVTGSFNPTQSGDTNNDENILIIHDKE